MNRYDCPRCGSNQANSFRSIYDQGTHTGQGSNGGRYVSQSALAQQLAPPARPQFGCGGMLLIILGSSFCSTALTAIFAAFINQIERATNISLTSPATMTMTFLIVFGILCGGGFFIAISSNRKRMPEYQEKLNRWSTAMYCRRCSNTWQG